MAVFLFHRPAGHPYEPVILPPVPSVRQAACGLLHRRYAPGLRVAQGGEEGDRGDASGVGSDSVSEAGGGGGWRVWLGWRRASERLREFRCSGVRDEKDPKQLEQLLVVILSFVRSYEYPNTEEIHCEIQRRNVIVIKLFPFWKGTSRLQAQMFVVVLEELESLETS